jgi:hypothetical protein
MNPTIYTFGDPGLVREALLALATIFNSAAWWDPSSGFSLGGNLLAAALIGLLGIALMAINSQKLRIDYLLTAFVLFAVTFGVKVDVNVEDIQTGSVAVVGDVPVGVAYVAAMSSGAARDLTETVSTALQRPGSTTSVLADTGFLQPLRVLLSMRGLDPKVQDSLLHETVVKYYRYCVGKTLENGGGFRMTQFMTSDEPLIYLTDQAIVQNWQTIEYTDARPEGQAVSCHTAADNIRTRVQAAMANPAGVLEYLKQQQGANRFNEQYAMGDIDASVSILFRGGVASSDFMAAQFMRNLHPDGEAWRTGDYGTSGALQAAIITTAMEQQRVESASEGTIFLQMMFPLMNFFQFLFFMLAPLVAFMIIAAPVASLKVLGFYLLFGVWSYSWMPAAAVINHYIQIVTQNDLIFGGGMYTSISGVDPFYNLVATKLVIGSNALAATPVIMATLLSGTMMGVSNLAGRLSGGAKADASIASPGLLTNGPLMARAAMSQAGVGVRTTGGGAFIGVSESAVAQGGGGSVSATNAGILARSRQVSESAREMLSESRGDMSQVMQRVDASAGQDSAVRAATSAAYSKGINSVVAEAESTRDLQGVQGALARTFLARGTPGAAGLNAGESAELKSASSQDIQAAREFAARKQDEVQARAAEELSKSDKLETGIRGDLSRQATELRNSAQAYERAFQDVSAAEQRAAATGSVEASTSWRNAEVAQRLAERTAGSRFNLTAGTDKMRSAVRSLGGEPAVQKFDEELAEKRAQFRPVGLDGKFTPTMVTETVAGLRALQDLVSDSPVFADALYKTLGEAGYAVPSVDSQSIGVQGMQEKIDGDRTDTRVNAAREGTAAEVTEATRDVANLRRGIASGTRGRIAATDIKAEQERHFSSVRAAQDTNMAKGREAAARVATSIAAAEKAMDGVATTAVQLIAPSGGFMTSYSQERISALQPGMGTQQEQAASELMAGLKGEVLGRNMSGVDPQAVYQDMLAKGADFQTAAIGAFAAVGRRDPGASDFLIYGAVLGGAGGQVAGIKAEQMKVAEQMAIRAGAQVSERAVMIRQLLGVAKVGGGLIGAVAGGTLGAAMYGWSESNESDAAQSALRKDFMAAVRMQQGDKAADRFEQYVQAGNVETGMEMVNAYSRFFSPTGENAIGATAGQPLGPAPGTEAFEQSLNDFTQRIERGR